MTWIRDSALTLVLMVLFAVSLAGQFAAGLLVYNLERVEHGRSEADAVQYLATGHLWEATFENWESEFLQMAVFVLLTTVLVQKGSPESRRPRVREPVDIDPRRFGASPRAPWPVRRGGWVLRLYENSLGGAFILLFVAAWVGHAIGGFAAYSAEQAAHGASLTSFRDYLRSSQFWFESFQNWQSEFLAIGSMVWLAVYLRQRRSPESKPVHAPHSETGH